MKIQKKTVSQVLGSILANLVSRGISLLNNRKYSSLHREEFRTIKFSWAQYGEDIVVYNLLKDKDPSSGYFVDAGAYHPFHLSTTNLLYKKGWRGINIDLEESKLNLFKRLRPEDQFAKAALSDQEEEVIYLKYDTPSLDRIVSKEVADKTSLGNHPRSETPIKTTRLENILASSAPLNKRFDYLNIDCEGNDLKVLEGLNFNKFRPSVISIEANTEGSKQEIFSFLDFYGYTFCCSLGVTQIFKVMAD